MPPYVAATDAILKSTIQQPNFASKP